MVVVVVSSSLLRKWVPSMMDILSRNDDHQRWIPGIVVATGRRSFLLSTPVPQSLVQMTTASTLDESGIDDVTPQ